MNSKVPSNSMIQDFVLLSVTQGMVDHKKAMKKDEPSFLVFHYHLFITQRMSGRYGFPGEYIFQIVTPLTQASDQWSPVVAHQTGPVRQRGHQVLPKDR